MTYVNNPVPVVLVDEKGVSQNTGAAFVRAPIAVTLTDKDGNTLSIGPSTGGGFVLPSPGYFFPNLLLFDTGADPNNIDPRAAQSISLCTSWKQFILPFTATISRYRFQTDGGTFTGGFFYAGIYNASGNLVFDIGKIDLSPGAGQYGKGAVHDPGTNLYDASRNPINSITLQPGIYYYAWGAEVASGTLVFPQMAPITSALWGETVNADQSGIAPVTIRWGHSATIDIQNGHLPLTITANGGATTNPPNITFFV